MSTGITRSEIMRRVRSKGNRSTEVRLRYLLVRSGIRGWRMHGDELVGKPDFVFDEKKLAAFVDGCFWHGCPKCYRRPKSSTSYWDQKVSTNIQRDKVKGNNLRKLNWKVLRIWEHELMKPEIVLSRIRKALTQ